MVLDRRLDKLEEVYGKKLKGNEILLVFVEEEIDKMEVLGEPEEGEARCLFSGNVQDGRDFLKTIKYEFLIEVPGPKEWAR